MICLWLSRELDIDIVHWACDINSGGCKEFIALEIINFDVAENQFPDFIRIRESLDPSGIDYFLVEIPQIHIFDVSVMRIECEIPNVLVTISFRRANALHEPHQKLEIDEVQPNDRTRKRHNNGYKNLNKGGCAQECRVLFERDKFEGKATDPV